MMRPLNRHLNNFILTAVCAVSFGLIAGCEKESEIPDNYIARVDNDFLTKQELSEIVQRENLNKAQVDDFIRKWIREKVLFKSAVAQEIEQDKEFHSLANSAYRQILIDMFIRRNAIAGSEIDTTELREFYNSNREKFRYDNDLYILNVIEFTDESDAEEFVRNRDKTFADRVASMPKDVNNYNVFSRRKYFDYELPSQIFFNAVKYLNRNEYSKVFKSEQSKFVVVQLVNKIDKGSTGSLQTSGELVRDAYLAEKRQAYLDKIVDKLYDEFEIEIKRDLIDYEN